jgi:mono/diheme cytochrome c family protein
MSYMKTEWIVVWTAIGTLVVLLLAALVVAATGSITVGADVKPSLIERALAPWACDRSVERHAPRVQNPYAGDPAAIAVGMDHYRENCLVCHGAPGIPATEIAKGLNPPSPSLGSEESDTPDGELFWVTKHGIRLTAMPAFGPTHTDEEIWKIVAFVRHLPDLTPEEKSYLLEATEDEQHHQQRRLEAHPPSHPHSRVTSGPLSPPESQPPSQPQPEPQPQPQSQ